MHVEPWRKSHIQVSQTAQSLHGPKPQVPWMKVSISGNYCLWASLVHEIYPAWIVFSSWEKAWLTAGNTWDIFSTSEQPDVSWLSYYSRVRLTLVEHKIWKHKLLESCDVVKQAVSLRVSLVLSPLPNNIYFSLFLMPGWELWCTLGFSIKEPWGIPWTGEPGQRIL